MARPPAQERRRKSRLRLPQTVRVRPSDPRLLDFDEILPTVNTSRDSVYFVSKNQAYEEGMRVFVTCPYSDGPGSTAIPRQGGAHRGARPWPPRDRCGDPHDPLPRWQRNGPLISLGEEDSRPQTKAKKGHPPRRVPLQNRR